MTEEQAETIIGLLQYFSSCQQLQKAFRRQVQRTFYYEIL